MKSSISYTLAFAYTSLLLSGCAQTPQVDTELSVHDDHDHEREMADEDAAALSADPSSLIDIKTQSVVRLDFEEAIRATGKIINDQNKEVHVNTLVPGRVNEVLADWGEAVKEGQVLACIESIELGRKRADHERAMAELELATADYQRMERLFSKDAVSERRLLEARAKFKSATINFQYAEKMLLLTGLNEEEIIEPPDMHPTIPGCSFHLASPINGVVIERNAVKGEKIEPGTCIYKILDLSSVWVETDVYEKDLSLVRNATGVKITVAAFPDRIFSGKVVYLGATLDESTRTVKLRSVVSNPDYDLKPGMFADISIIVGSHHDVVAVPEEAILSEEGNHFVFVKEHGDHFHRHDVEIGKLKRDGMVAVLSGLSEGQEIVVQGQHQMKSRALMEEADPHAGHTH
jgi:cobalt-zinc-cadmium efflux system membrane fusion protein